MIRKIAVVLLLVTPFVAGCEKAARSDYWVRTNIDGIEVHVEWPPKRREDVVATAVVSLRNKGPNSVIFILHPAFASVFGEDVLNGSINLSIGDSVNYERVSAKHIMVLPAGVTIQFERRLWGSARMKPKAVLHFKTVLPKQLEDMLSYELMKVIRREGVIFPNVIESEPIGPR